MPDFLMKILIPQNIAKYNGITSDAKFHIIIVCLIGGGEEVLIKWNWWNLWKIHKWGVMWVHNYMEGVTGMHYAPALKEGTYFKVITTSDT